MLMRLWKDDSGVAAAEYALIVAVVGGLMVLAAGGLGVSIKGAMDIKTVAPNGTVYHCTQNCAYVYTDYCEAIHDTNPAYGDLRPVFVPALPSSDPSCN